MVRGDEQTDDVLARAAAGGDRRALELLLHRHAERIHAICRRVLAHHEDSLDAAQEAMIAVARGIVRFDGRSQFTTWLYRVATNAALDEARRRNRRPRPVETLPEPRSGVDRTDAIVDQIVIDDAMASLPPDFRAAVALRDLAGLDYADIADVLGIPPGTVRSRIARGRAALADRLVGATTEPTDGNQSDRSERPTATP